MDDTFVDVGTLVKRNMVNRFCLKSAALPIFSKMVDNSAIDEFIIKPIIYVMRKLSAKGELAGNHRFV